MNYQSDRMSSSTGTDASFESQNGKTMSIPGRMNLQLPQHFHSPMGNHCVGSQIMPAKNRGVPSGIPTSDDQRLNSSKKFSQINTLPDSGTHRQPYAMSHTQSGTASSCGDSNSRPSGAKAPPDLVRGSWHGTGPQSSLPFMYSQNGQANTDPLQYLPQQMTKFDRYGGNPSKSSWYAPPGRRSGLPSAQHIHLPQMTSQQSQFLSPSRAEAAQNNHRQASQVNNGMPMRQDNKVSAHGGANLYDSLQTMQNSSPAGTQFGQYQQHMTAPVQRILGGLPQDQFPRGLGPRPLQTTFPQQQHVEHSSTSNASNYSANDFMSDQDLFSPTPIHPDHQLNQSLRLQQQRHEFRQNSSQIQQSFQGSNQGGQPRFPHQQR
jgi:hypothetical protein